LGSPRPITKSHPEEKWAWPWARGTPQNRGYPFNISATTADSDFKIGRLVGIAATAHHKIPPRRKRGRGPGLDELPKFCGFAFNIFAMAEVVVDVPDRKTNINVKTKFI